METFEYYLEQGVVRKSYVNFERAKSLVKDAKKRIKTISFLDVNKFSKIIFDNIYDALMNLCNAILLINGYKSYSSHEALIAYLLKKDFDISVTKRLDNFRYKRNGSKYYGEDVSIEEAKDINNFYLEIRDKLYKILNIMVEDK